MATKREYMEFILGQLSGLEGVDCRPMMGEYVIYCGGKVIGGIYDDRFLVKPTKSALEMVPDTVMELPYEGAKEMLPAENVDDREFLKALVSAVAADLPAPKSKKPKAAPGRGRE